MSANLMWEPVIQRGKGLSNELKYILKDKYLDNRTTEILTNEDLSFLSGVKAASNESIKKEIDILTEAIEKHGEIKIWLQY